MALVITIGALTVMIAMCALVIDVARFFQHKRALQVQADAAALAAAGDFTVPCADQPILARAADYAQRNMPAGIPASRWAMAVNQPNFDGQSTPNDTDITSSPCASAAIDVKVTERSAPWLFRAASVSHINAQARVSLRKVTRQSGLLPVAVPDVHPKRVLATFVNEATGATLATTELHASGTSGGLAIWDDATSPVSVPITAARIGVRLAVSGSSTTVTCGQPLVDCFDSGSANGLVYVRGWTRVADSAHPTSPVAKDLRLVAGTCADAYFAVSTSSCTIGLRGTVTFQASPTTIGAKLTAVVGGTSYPLTYDSTSQTWSTGTVVPIAAAAGPVDVALNWEQTSGTWESNTCTTQNKNPCKGTLGVVQRTFAGSDDRSGEVRGVTLAESGSTGANSFERCSSALTSCTHSLVVRVGIQGSLSDAASRNDPAVALRVVGGTSQTQALDCDPNISNLKDELAYGCAPTYTLNSGTVCPAGASALWSTPQPWSCTAIGTGVQRNQVAAGMNLRVLGSDKPSTCTNPNRWSTFPNIDPADPRVVQLMTTPYGTFSGNGQTTFPIIGFATFYVTGWASQSGGFSNPCQGNGDDPVSDGGVLLGHFIKYINRLNGGSGSTEACDFNDYGTCVAVLTK